MNLRDCINKTFLGVIISIIVLIIMLDLAWLIGAKYFLNTKFSSENVEKKLNSIETISAQINNLSFIPHWNFTLSIAADKIDIKENNDQIIAIKNAYTQISVPSLLLKKINIQLASADYIFLNIVKSAEGKINILKLLPSQINQTKQFHLNKMILDVNQYKLELKDDSIQHNTELNGKDLNVNTISNKLFSIRTSGTIGSTKNKELAKYDINTTLELPLKKNLTNNNSNINIFVENLNLKEFSPWTKYIKSTEIDDITGTINAKITTTHKTGKKTTSKVIGNIKTENLQIKEKLPEHSTYLKENADINFILQLMNGNIIVDIFSLKTPNHNIGINGEILHAGSNRPQLALKLKLHNNITSMIYNAIPSELSFENNIITKIKKYKPKATIDGEISINGDVKSPDIEGEFYTDDLFIDLPIAKEAKAKLKLIFNKKRLQILGNVNPNNNSNVHIDGSLNIYGEKNAVFEITSEKNVKLTVVKAVLMPIQDTFTLNFGILNQITVNDGYGDATLKISGTRQNSKVYGKLNFHSGKAGINGINSTIENLKGTLDFNGKDVNFATTSATIKSDDIQIYGNATLLGAFNANIESGSIKTQTLLDILKSSKLLAPINQKSKEITNIKGISGNSKIKINVNSESGNTKTLDLNNVKYLVELDTQNNTLLVNRIIPQIKIIKANGRFTNESVLLDTTAQILNSKLKLNVKILDDKLNLISSSDKFFIRDLIALADTTQTYKSILDRTEQENKSCLKFNATYNSPIDKIDLKNLDVKAQLFYDKIKQNISNNPVIYATQGEIIISKGHIILNKLFLNLLNANIALDGKINNIFTKKPDYDLNFELKNFDLSVLNDINTYKFFDNNTKKVLSAYEKYKGTVCGKLKINTNNINGKLLIRDIGFTQKKMQLPIYVSSADVLFIDSNIIMKSLNGIIDEVPVFASIQINNIFDKPLIKGYTTSNIYPSFINKFINANLGYPIKLKGEIAIKSDFQGTVNSIKSKTSLTLPIGSDISYMGATLGDTDFKREIFIDMTQAQNKFNINNATFSKYIISQNRNQTKYPYIKLFGEILATPEYLQFNNLNIKTLSKTSSSFFNVLFKKSVLKYGDFTCNLNINGTSIFPKVQGFINLNNLGIPLYETTINDIVINLTPHNINTNILGKIYDTNITATANIENKLTAPYHIKDIKINADYLDLENLLDSISKVTMKNQNTIKSVQNNEIQAITPNSITLDKGTVNAKKILVKGFPATDLIVNFTQPTSKILKINNFDFKIAEGQIKANGQYNFETNTIKADCIATSIDANQFSQIFLNLKNQIYGNLDGIVKLETKGITPEERLENLNGAVSFNIDNGKMPKLGSLEYLLRAANVVKSGITGFTINNIINLLIPIKTGEFSTIKGDIELHDGIANNIKIYSKGENLSLYITGEGNLITQYSKLNVYGRLSKKISTLLGPIGNTSINTLFNFIPGIKLNESESLIFKELNKIPGLEFSNDEYRFFHATIDGDVNSENYVQSFKWLE